MPVLSLLGAAVNDSVEMDEAETRLLGIESSSRARSAVLGTSTRSTRTSSRLHTSTRPRTATPSLARDKADDQLNEMLDAKHGLLETKWIILIVAVVLLLFTAMATAAFVLRRCHRTRVRARKQQEEQRAMEEEQRLAGQDNLGQEDGGGEYAFYPMNNRQSFTVV